jgi:hypothetical protein
MGVVRGVIDGELRLFLAIEGGRRYVENIFVCGSGFGRVRSIKSVLSKVAVRK